MVQRSLKWVLLLSCLAAFCSCNRSKPKASPESVFDRVRLQFEQGELVAAQAAADRAYHDYLDGSPEWAFRFRVLQAEIMLWEGRSADARALLDFELPASLTTDEVMVRKRLLQSLLQPRYEDAKRSIEEANTIAQANYPQLLGEVEEAKGKLSFRNGDSAHAQASFQNAILIARQKRQPFLEASAEGNLGLLAMNTQHYGEAIDWNKTALGLSESIGARALIAKIKGNLGWGYYKMGDLNAASELFTEAEKLSAQLGLQNDQLRRLVNIGNVHYERREFAEARSYYARALQMAEQTGDTAEQAVCLNNLASVALEERQFDDAEQYNREALQLKRGNNDRISELYGVYNAAKISMGRGDMPSAESLLGKVIGNSAQDFYLRWEAQAALASLYAASVRPAEAEQQFQKAMGTINLARSSLNREEYRLSFLSSAISFYDDYVAFLASRGKRREALHVVEINRARTLSEGLGLTQDSSLGPSAAFQPEQTARRMGAIILSYWLARERSYLWVITSSKVEMIQLAPQSEIEQVVRNYRSALAGARDVRETANVSGQKLYEMLVAPARKLIPNGSQVIIIPDGGLHELNFETLLVPGDQLHYWIEDVVVANASSLLLLQGSSSANGKGQRNLLLLGDPVSPNAQYTALPQAASEIGQIKNYFPQDQVQVYAGQSATSRAYLGSNPGKYSFIHFVAHGVASRESPLDSAVILSGDESSYKLYAREIIKVPLTAKLVTISSCEGASGRTYAGEGLVGLSWAFLRAGAHQVVAALWEVNDAATPEFMHQFYAGISAGSEPAIALRTAKLAMLHSDTIYRRPFYWAPFQLYQGR